ncbi:MAG: helix-turn-helix domain-containing protein, partial [Candidatus Rokubacteria bacterium]|nr:helix-turn-helix domain-containing protein [Candidatus Rokubacteria bacterium]
VRDVIPKDTMTVTEASTYLPMDVETLKRMAAERRIPALEQDGQWVFSKKSIDKWRTRSRA